MRIPELKLNQYSILSRIIFWAQKMKYGQTLWPSKIWGRSPALILGVQFFYRALDRKSSPIDIELRILLNIKVSQINHCAFCVDIAEGLLLNKKVSEKKVFGIENYTGKESLNKDLYTPKEQAALNYAMAMTYSDQLVTDETFSSLKKFFSDQEIIELTAIIAYQNLSSKFNAALNIPAQGFCSKNVK